MGSVFSLHKTEEEERDAWRKDLRKRYDGTSHTATGIRYERPFLSPSNIDIRLNDLEDGDRGPGKQTYLNIRGNNDHEKYPDLDTYYSTTKEIPRRLIVQATPEARHDQRARHWSHSKIEGNAPFVVRLSEFCLNPLRFDKYNTGFVDEDSESVKKTNIARMIAQAPVRWIASALLTFFFAWIIQVVLSIEIVTAPWTDSGDAGSYDGYENVHWGWPHHAVNKLEQSPDNKMQQSKVTRLTIPRRLVVKDQATGRWAVKMTDDIRDEHTGMLEPYVFLSFSRANFIGIPDSNLRTFFYRVAEAILAEENKRKDGTPVKAFWLDMECVASDSPVNGAQSTRQPVISAESEKTNDINTICDAVRCAKRVYVVLPDESQLAKKIWGTRIWTLPEVLLAADKIRYCIAPLQDNLRIHFEKVSLNDMYNSFWVGHPSRALSNQSDKWNTHEDAITHLINHYTNRTKLSELQLFTFAVHALAQLSSGQYKTGESTVELAYAAMGLLAYRITPDGNEDVFQAIARLSLVNDSNRLLERMLCLWPHYGANERNPHAEANHVIAGSEALLKNIAGSDQYSVHLWDINPLCDVVGIGNDKFTPTVIVDRCRGIPIRWKRFPRMRYIQDLASFRATLAQTIVFAGVWATVTGFGIFSSAISLTLVNHYGRTETNIDIGVYLYGVAIFAGVGWIISWFSPLAVHQLCTTRSCGVSCHLTGFEGTMSLKKIERAIYGNYGGRLSYSSTSSILSKDLRDERYRMGLEPPLDPNQSEYSQWEGQRKKHNIPDSHRLFTIVDTGDMTVTVIAAQRPPVVALIAGREGGMLRAVLCSWRFESNCLYRECVVRMRSSLEDQASPNDWLKISLASQDDVNNTRSFYQRRDQPPHSSASGSAT